MHKKKLLGLTKQLYICKGGVSNEVYLTMVSAKSKREISQADLKKLPDSCELFEMQMFDICSFRHDQPLEPQFDLITPLNKDFALNNRYYSHGLYLNADLDVIGPLLLGSRLGFNFVRSGQMYRECGPIKPLLSQSESLKYPCLVYCGPNPTRDKVYV